MPCNEACCKPARDECRDINNGERSGNTGEEPDDGPSQRPCQDCPDGDQEIPPINNCRGPLRQCPVCEPYEHRSQAECEDQDDVA